MKHFFKNTIIIIFSILTSLLCEASYKGPMYGSTFEEREIRWLWRYINDFLYSCKNSEKDCKNSIFQPALDELISYAPVSESTPNTSWEFLLDFVSEKDRPDLFKSSEIESHRLAVTSLKKYSTVYINKDRMNLPLETWVGILVHEAIHHLGIDDGPNRLPDQIGAEIGKHFKKQIQVSSLSQFNLSTTHTLTFNPAARGRGSVGFITAGFVTTDIGWEPISIHPVCDNNEKVVQQFVSSPAWRVNRIQTNRAIVTVRGGGYIRSTCMDETSKKEKIKILPLDATVPLQFPAPFDPENWVGQVPIPIVDEELTYGPSNNVNDFMFGLVQTFFVELIKHESLQIEAGDILRTTILLKSVDEYQPTQCQLALAGMQYSYVSQDHLPGSNLFETCTVKSLGRGRYQVDGQVTIPLGARPDLYYVPALLFGNNNRYQRSAVPTIPTFIKVTNRAALEPPVIKKIDILNLARAEKIGVAQITNSFKIGAEQSFQVEFIVEGRQQAFEPWVDVDIWYLLPTEFGIAKGTGSARSWPQVLTHTEITQVSNGTKVVFTFKMPTQLSGLQIAALKIKKFYLKTSDYSWVEIEFPNRLDHMVINEKYGE